MSTANLRQPAEIAELPLRLHDPSDALASQSPSLAGEAAHRAAAKEVKFLLTETLAQAVESQLREVLARDPHCGDSGAYQLTSLYCDTPQWDVLHRVGRFALCKFRLRCYGDAEQIYLERKARKGSQVRKRRSHISLPELDLLVHETSHEDWAGAWYRRQLRRHDLRPACLVSYERAAYFGFGSEGPLRLTFDRNIIGSLTSDWSFARPENCRRLLPQHVVCEFKFRGNMPAPFKQVIHDLQLTIGRCSKYRTCLREFGVEERSAHDA